MTGGRGARRGRADGAESRRRILDAAVEIAAERGYGGTGIAAVSARCGLPASSIYWHFADKDALIAAVIERSFTSWVEALALPAPDSGTAEERARAMAVAVGKAFVDSPDFLRLGLMLTLERRPTEPAARTAFLRLREIAVARVAAVFTELAPELPAASVRLLTTYAIAGAEGLFVAREIGGDAVDLHALFDLHARTLIDAVARELGCTPEGKP